MAESPSYGTAEIRAEVQAWQDAAVAARRGDQEEAARLLIPDGRDEGEAYSRMHSQTLIGAALIARRLAQLENVPPLVHPQGREWVLAPSDPTRENTAVDRVAGAAVTALANGEPERGAAALVAFSSPDDDGVARLGAVMQRLLALYVALDDALHAPRGGAR